MVVFKSIVKHYKIVSVSEISSKLASTALSKMVNYFFFQKI